MQNLKRNKNITFRVSEQEYAMISRRMGQTHITNLRAYLLKRVRNLCKKISGQPLDNDSDALKNAVPRLRKKPAGSGCAITAKRGGGYCFGKESRLEKKLAKKYSTRR